MVRLPLSEAKARLSELVRQVRQREEVIVTVDGEPAVRITRVFPPPRSLTATDLATERVLLDTIRKLAASVPLDAVDVVREGRR
jgi:prevent-host-death family protein